MGSRLVRQMFYKGKLKNKRAQEEQELSWEQH